MKTIVSANIGVLQMSGGKKKVVEICADDDDCTMLSEHETIESLRSAIEARVAAGETVEFDSNLAFCLTSDEIATLKSLVK